MSEGFWFGLLILVALVWYDGDALGKAVGGMVNSFNQTIGECK